MVQKTDGPQSRHRKWSPRRCPVRCALSFPLLYSLRLKKKKSTSIKM